MTFLEPSARVQYLGLDPASKHSPDEMIEIQVISKHLGLEPKYVPDQIQVISKHL